MKPVVPHSAISRRVLLSTLAALPVLPGLRLTTVAQAQQLPEDRLASVESRASEARPFSTSCARRPTAASPSLVPPEERIATFDQDGTLWVERPIYTQVMFVLEGVPALVKAKPELARCGTVLKTVLELLKGDRAAIGEADR